MPKSLHDWVNTEVAELKKIPKRQYYEKDFFRDPLRPQFVSSNYFFSPADGIILYQKVVKPDDKIIEVKGKDFTLKDLMYDDSIDFPALVIGIFMSQYDVHINRLPYSGLVKYEDLPVLGTLNRPMLMIEDDIFDEKIVLDDLDYLFYNERRLNTIICPQINYIYYLVQIADEDVDVISHFVEQNSFVLQNDRLGVVRYGSQVDLILPMPMPFKVTSIVKSGYHVKAGLDRLLELDFKKPKAGNNEVSIPG